MQFTSYLFSIDVICPYLTCRDNGINIVNIYSATRQPISFVIGTSIQSHHPLVKAYEFEKSSYTWNVEIQNNQLKK